MDYALQQATWEAKKAARAFAAKQLQIAHPHLIPDTGNSLITATKNIRIELKRAFPSIKFAIHSKRFSGGDDINVSWTDGPTTQQVDSIIQCYRMGHFDGSTDSYDYRDDHAWTDAFGDSKYIFSSRDYSDKMLNSIIGRVCRHLGGMDKIPTPEDYNKGQLWKFKQSGGCDVEREIHQALSKHTYCI